MCWCDACDRAEWYPKAQCSRCGGDTTWRTLSGEGILLAGTGVTAPLNPAFATPYVPARVEPVEAPGARLVTQIVDYDALALRCDMPVHVTFTNLRRPGGAPYRAPLFKPVT